MADAAAVEHDGAVAVGDAAPELGDAAAAPAELSARLPTGVTAAEFADSSPAVQALILARAAVVFADEFAASQLPLPPPDVRVSLPTGVTSADFANATAGVKQIIRGASTVTKKRAHDDVGSVVARSAAELQARLLTTGHLGDRLQDELLAAVSHPSAKGPLSVKTPKRSGRWCSASCRCERAALVLLLSALTGGVLVLPLDD
jgi:hypothetical protein